MESSSNTKRVRVDSDESEFNESKRIRPDLLEVLEDSESHTVNPKLDSFMKSLEKEILNADLDSVSGECPPDLDFLFGASDDELGLPPADITPVESEKSVVLTESVELESFEYGFDCADGDLKVNTRNEDDEYVKLDGLFEGADVGLGSPHRSVEPETMPAQ